MLTKLQLSNKRQLICKVSQVKMSKVQVHAYCFSHCTSTTATLLFCRYTQQCTTLHFRPNICCLLSVLLVCNLVACHMQEQTSPSTTKVKVFKLLLDTYIYSAALGTFIPLPSMPPKLPAQLCAAAKALRAIEHGKPKPPHPQLTWQSLCCSLSNYWLVLLLTLSTLQQQDEHSLQRNTVHVPYS